MTLAVEDGGQGDAKESDTLLLSKTSPALLYFIYFAILYHISSYSCDTLLHGKTGETVSTLL